MKEEKIYCAECGKEIIKPAGSCMTGYGEFSDGRKICYECCGKIDREALINLKKGEKLYMYLIEENGEYFATNWPGSLKLRIHHKPYKGRHNIAGCRYDVYFMCGGRNFHGVQYGDMTQVLHVNLTK